MRNLFLLALISLSYRLAAQESLGSFYVSVKAGLSLREKPDAGARFWIKYPIEMYYIDNQDVIFYSAGV